MIKLWMIACLGRTVWQLMARNPTLFVHQRRHAGQRLALQEF
jgi:hypothetical protein